MKSVILHKSRQDYRSKEAYKVLRTNIEFSGVENQVLLVTSSIPNEGKSTISMGLACALSEAGKKVLLVDADLRKSVMMGRYRVTEEVKGLTHYLSGHAEVEEIVCKTQDQGLSVVFAGIVPPNPSELLGSKRFEKFIGMMRRIFDYILIDAPPLGSVIDAAVIAQVCDASILVIGANTVSRRYIRTVRNQLEKTGCPLLGAVLNKADFGQNKYYGRYYGEYDRK